MVFQRNKAIKNQCGIFSVDEKYRCGIFGVMKLASYLLATDMTETAFAQSLGVSQVTINRYVRNERFPDPEMIHRIEVASEGKVTVTDWYEQAADHRASKEAEKAA